jgi:ABC-type transport system substrate-binding protein
MQEWFYPAAGYNLAFGYEADSPFRDRRVRQAVSMLVDRDAMADVIGGRERFRKAGLNVEARTAGLVGPAWETYWIDPADESKFGAGAQNLRFNPEAAKSLLAAAGLVNGLDTDLYYADERGAERALEYTTAATILPQMLGEGGVRVRPAPRNYATDYLPNYHFAYVLGERKGFNGLVLRPETAYPTVGLWLNTLLNPEGARFVGATVDGTNAGRGDPALTSMLNGLRGEFDADRLRERVQAVARYTAGAAYAIPVNPFTLPFSVIWPVIGNYGFYRSNTAVESALQWWVDTSKPPLRQGK